MEMKSVSGHLKVRLSQKYEIKFRARGVVAANSLLFSWW